MMKKLFILCYFALTYFQPAFSQTATNFNVPDCSGVDYELFAELDAGKVVVIGWTMPCNPCILPLKTTYNVVQSYAEEHPGIVEMILADDYANTPCDVINIWANSAGLDNTRRFSNAAIRMLDYGTNGMPKVVVVAGKDRKVYYNADYEVDHEELIKAINLAISTITSTSEKYLEENMLRVVPNPASGHATLHFSLGSDAEVGVQVFNQFGQQVAGVFNGKMLSGNQSVDLPVSALPVGVYVVQVQLNDALKFSRFKIVK